MLKGTFLKVAHVLPLQANGPTLDTENVYESVYVVRCLPSLPKYHWIPLQDMREQPDLPVSTFVEGLEGLVNSPLTFH
jgi:hypothetical protein